MADQLHVLVVGAGPVGLSAALFLVRAGIGVRIIDAADTVDRRMRGSTFHPPTLDMIDKFGLSAPLVGLGRKVARWQLRQHEAGKHVDFDLELLGDATAHPFRLQVEQHRYCALLIEALRDLGVVVEFRTRIENLEQDSAGVTSRVGRGDDIRSEWVIGADGSHGITRKLLGLEYGGTRGTHTSVLISTNFPFHEYLDGLADISDCWSNRGSFSLLRMRDCWRVNLYPAVDELDAATDHDHLHQRLAGIHPDASDAKILGVSPYRVHQRCVGRFRAGRVLLAGDAAHLNPPAGGMGMNCGIHDAMNMSEKLVEVLNGADDSLLDRYDRQRRRVAYEHVIPQSTASRARLADADAGAQVRRLARYQAIAADTGRCREFLLASSMITALREAETID